MAYGPGSKQGHHIYFLYRVIRSSKCDLRIFKAENKKKQPKSFSARGLSGATDRFTVSFREKFALKKVNAVALRVKAIELDKRLKAIVDSDNDGDNLVFINEAVVDFINELSDELIKS